MSKGRFTLQVPQVEKKVSMTTGLLVLSVEDFNFVQQKVATGNGYYSSAEKFSHDCVLKLVFQSIFKS